MTIRDIAREAGVSTATVSRALRGLSNVHPRTRAKVMGVVEQFDYTVSPSASRLKSGRIGAVAALTPRISSRYFATLLSGAEPVFQTAALDLLLVGTGATCHQHRRQSPRALRRKVDGFLVLGPDLVPEVLDALELIQLPLVLVGAVDARLSSIFVDDVQGARTATNHLLELGHKRIALMTGDPSSDSLPDRDRRLGFTVALAAAGVHTDPELMVFGGFTAAGAETAMRDLLALPERPTAVFAVSDEMALGAIRAIRAAGLVPGHDVSVVGYDGTEFANVLDLTTVAQPVEMMGQEGARLLVDQLRDPSAATRHVQFATELIRRGSSGPLEAPPARARSA